MSSGHDAFLSLVPSSTSEARRLLDDGELRLSRTFFEKAVAAAGSSGEAAADVSADADRIGQTFAMPSGSMDSYFGTSTLVRRHDSASLAGMAAGTISDASGVFSTAEPAALMRHDALVLGEVVDLTTHGVPANIKVLEVRLCLDKLLFEKKNSKKRGLKPSKMRVWDPRAIRLSDFYAPEDACILPCSKPQRRPGSQKLLEAQFSPGVKVVAVLYRSQKRNEVIARLDYDGQALRRLERDYGRIHVPQPGRLERIVAAAEHRKKGTRVVRVHKESELVKSAKGSGDEMKVKSSQPGGQEDADANKEDPDEWLQNLEEEDDDDVQSSLSSDDDGGDGEDESELLQLREGEDLILPVRCKLELGACGTSIPTSGASCARPVVDAKSIGWNVINVDLAESNVHSHHGLYEWLRGTPQFMNVCASQNMADALQLNQSFSVVDPFFGKKALKDYRTINKEQSRAWAVSRIKIGNRYNKGGDYAEAKTWYSQAISLDRSCADAWVAKATTYANMKQYEKAIKHLEEAMRLDPEVRNAKEYLENVRAAQAAAAQKEAAAQASAQKRGSKE